MGSGQLSMYCIVISLAGYRVAVLKLATLVFLAGNHISDEQRDKEQESRRKAKKRA